MKNRPLSITIIAWLLVIFASIDLIMFAIAIHNPEMVDAMRANSKLPMSAQYCLISLNVLGLLISGIAMLKGKNWARMMYIGLAIITLTVDLLTSIKSPLLYLPALMFLLVICFFLFRPKANVFFNGTIN